MAGWMAYALAVAVLLGLAAAAAERALRARGLPTRWAWAGSLAGSWVLALWAWLRPAPMPEPAPPAALVGPELAELLAMADTGAGATPFLPDWAGTVLGWGWAALALGGIVVLGVAYVRVLRLARRWPRARIAGVPVVVSEGFGPAVLGVLDPRIVLPRWVFGLDAGDRDLVLRHEESHRDARDTMLLTAAAVGTALAPWNPALWWQLRRLRAAVELDCDRRVLGGGVSPRAYAALLLAVGERTASTPLPVAALAEPPSFLERRLTMIAEGTGRRTAWSGALAGAAALALAVGACETPAPMGLNQPAPAEPSEARESGTARDPEPGAGAIAGTITIREMPARLDAPLVFVDDEEVADFPAGIEPDDIDRIEVIKGGAARELYGDRARHGVIRIWLREAGFEAVEVPGDPGEGAAPAVIAESEDGFTVRGRIEGLETSDGRPIVGRLKAIGAPGGGDWKYRATPATGEAPAAVAAGKAGEARAIYELREIPSRTTEPEEVQASSWKWDLATGPIAYVDGERWTGTAEALKALRIESVNVMKGEEAARYGPEARARGVVLVTTRR